MDGVWFEEDTNHAMRYEKGFAKKTGFRGVTGGGPTLIGKNLFFFG